jgi:hypothetical protein
VQLSQKCPEPDPKQADGGDDDDDDDTEATDDNEASFAL